jgi:hypothetical protein
MQYFDFIVYLIYDVIFITIILVIRNIHYYKIFGVSPKEVGRRLREKGISRLTIAIAPLLGRYYLLSGKIGLKYEVFKIFEAALFMACFMGMALPPVGLFIGKSSLSVSNVPKIFTYTFIAFFLGGLPFAFYHYYLIKSGRGLEI